MRAFIALVLALLAALAIYALLSTDGEVAPAMPGDGVTAPAVPDAAMSVAQPAANATATALQPQRVPEGLATEVTAVLQVMDATSGTPVEGAAVYRLREAVDEAAIAWTDARGIAPLPLGKPSQLMVARAGYLLRMAPTQIGTTEGAPQQVRLIRDEFSARAKFRFRRPDGSVPDEVCVIAKPLRSDAADQPMPEKIRVAAEETQRAWREQRTLAGVRAVPELHVQLGFHNAAFVHVLRGEDEIAFVESGKFAIEAATPDGFCCAFETNTDDFARGPIQVALLPGAQLRGVVRSEQGAVVQGAWIEVDGGDPLRLVARSDETGAFSIGPFAIGERRLRVRHRDHATAVLGPFAPPADALQLSLVALPKSSVRGRIVAAGKGEPLRSATASLLVDNGAPIVVPCDDEGYFAIAFAGSDALRLNAGADGFLTHSELVNPGAEAFIELWPSSQEQRIELGLTARISGVVVDANGAPMPRMGVRFVADQSQGAAPSERRILGGGAMSLPQAVTTGADGSFVLEVATFGPGLVQPIDGSQDEGRGVRTDAQKGATITGLRVAARRR